MDHLSNSHLLSRVDDTRVFRSRGMQSKEIVILSKDYPLLSKSKGEMFLVARAEHSGFRRRQRVNAALPQTLYDRLRHMFVGVGRILSLTRLSRRELPSQLRGGATAKLFSERLASPDGFVYLGPMVEIIGERGVHVGQRQVVLGGDLIGALSHPLVPDDDILDRDAVSRDTGLAPRDAKRYFNVFVRNYVHERIVPERKEPQRPMADLRNEGLTCTMAVENKEPQ